METQADLSAMNDKYVWAKEMPSRRKSVRHSVGIYFWKCGEGREVCGKWGMGWCCSRTVLEGIVGRILDMSVGL